MNKTDISYIKDHVLKILQERFGVNMDDSEIDVYASLIKTFQFNAAEMYMLLMCVEAYFGIYLTSAQLHENGFDSIYDICRIVQDSLKGQKVIVC